MVFACANISSKTTCNGTIKEHLIVSWKGDFLAEISDLFAVLKQQQGQLWNLELKAQQEVKRQTCWTAF